jgi:hypothetical protein
MIFDLAGYCKRHKIELHFLGVSNAIAKPNVRIMPRHQGESALIHWPNG